MILREARRMSSGALTKDQQIGERVSSQPIRAVQAGGAFSSCEESRNGGRLRLGVDAHSAHDVVRGRTHLHRFLGDVDVRQLHELVVHAGQLLLDHLLGVLHPALDPADVEKHAAVRAPAPLADLAHDAAAT